MKKTFLLFAVLLISLTSFAQNFKYAFVSDTHIGSANADEDLRRTVADINSQPELEFTIITGDITEMGTNEELKLAREILSGLKKPYYIMPGNHDTGWSESGGVSFIKEFGYDKFTFDFKGYRFIGCASGPYVRMSDGHIPRDATVWLTDVLKKTPKDMPIIFANHYPIDNSLDNWYEVTDRLKTKNIQYIICGHGHNNHPYNFEGIPATMGRSNLRAKDSIGGYNVVNMTKDTVYFSLKKPMQALLPAWRKIPYKTTGKRLWSYQTKGAIYSSPVATKQLVILGSGDGNIYALNIATGKLLWKVTTGHSVLGSPIIDGNTVFIGGSDHNFRALDVNTGKLVWKYQDVEGAIVGKPLIYSGKIIFGSWGRHLYALDLKTGSLVWKWNNGNMNRMFSPAMVTPVATNGVVYIAAPDRFLTAIDVNNGQTLWRNKAAGVRESIGLSADSITVYGKTMQDEVVGYATQTTDPGVAWKFNAGFGYEHAPSQLIEKDGKVFFGTRNGVVYVFDPKTKQNLWGHKIDNSMVNTVNVIDGKTVLVSTMDGKVTLLKSR
ncbi:MAG: metallophosphoesterase [Pedobacter sp.]|nr:MAG: metallophosphoesterase [Pedobacter sp.]